MLGQILKWVVVLLVAAVILLAFAEEAFDSLSAVRARIGGDDGPSAAAGLPVDGTLELAGRRLQLVPSLGQIIPLEGRPRRYLVAVTPAFEDVEPASRPALDWYDLLKSRPDAAGAAVSELLDPLLEAFAAGEGQEEGAFLNLLIVDRESGTARPVLPGWGLVRSYQIASDGADRFLILVAVTRDSDGDGILAPGDQGRLFVYDLALDRLREAETGPHACVLDAADVIEEGRLVLRIALDSDRDGRCAIDLEGALRPADPRRFAEIDLRSLAVTPIVPDAAIEDLARALAPE